MPEVIPTSVADLRSGDRIGQDLMSGDTVWLRSGTVLSDLQIERIQRMGLPRVMLLPDSAGAGAAPDFSALASDSAPRWMSDASFAQSVEPPAPPSPEELRFAQEKLELRTGAGLRPLLEPGLEAELHKSLQTAFISAASTGRVDLRKVDDVARTLAASMPENSEDYFFFTDVARYGQHLIARSIMSSKVFVFAKPEDTSREEIVDLLRAHLALQSAFALLPTDLSRPLETHSDDERVQFRTALLQYFNWLRSQDYLPEATLEEVAQQFERHDGTGAPFGLSGEQISLGGQTWALAIAYSERVFSRPRRYRLSPHQAADELVRLSGGAFASSAVNRFLRLMGFFPNGSMVELNDSRLAVVVRQNERGLLKPVVRITDSGEEVDLKANPTVFIRRQILEY